MTYIGQGFNAEEVQAEREAIMRLAQRPDDWQALDDRPELAEAADRLLAVDLVVVRWGAVTWEYMLTDAARRVAYYLAPQDDRAFRAHPLSNYDGGIIPMTPADLPPQAYIDALAAKARGEDIEPGSDQLDFYR